MGNASISASQISCLSLSNAFGHASSQQKFVPFTSKLFSGVALSAKP